MTLHGSRLHSLIRLFFIGVLSFPSIHFAQSGAGSLDLTFNGTGYWTGHAGVKETRAQDSVVLPDGKIIVVGEFLRQPSNRVDALVQRHLPDGSLDTSFGTEGRLVLPTTSAERIFHAVTLQPDGKILAAGWLRTELAQYVYQVDILTLRLLPDGSLDASFGSNGLAITPVPGRSAYIYDVAVKADGHILAAGWSPGSTSDIGVFRLNENGTLDTSFADHGAAVYPYSPENYVQKLLLLPDGRMILAGYTFENSQQIGLLICLKADGSQDTQVSADGSLSTAFSPGTHSSFNTLLALPGDRVLVGGTTYINDQHRLFLRVYGPDRTLDPTFGTDGMARPVFGNRDDAIADAAVTASGQILVLSTSYPNGVEQPSNIALARLHSNGSVDFGFGEDGQIVADLQKSAAPFTLARTADHLWLASGAAYDEEGAVVALARFLTGPATVILQDEDDATLQNGTELTFKPVAAGFTSQRQVEVIHPGGDDLADVRLTMEGIGFDFFPAPASLEVPVGRTVYTLRFNPTGAPGPRTGVLKVTQGTASTVLLEIPLAGQVFSPTEDSDGDGLNDVTEFKLAALGFDPVTAQPEKVNLLFGSLGEAQPNLNAAGYQTPDQIAELHAGSLLEKDPQSGQFILRLRLEQSTSLTNFVPFPLIETGVTLTPQGHLEYRFTPAANRTFYRLARP